MCQVFAGQSPASYAQVTRSVRIAGHCTSIRLEAAFWVLLDGIAAEQDITTPKFLSVLYDEALEIHGEVGNFASLLRTTCLLYLRDAIPLRSDRVGLRTAAA